MQEKAVFARNWRMNAGLYVAGQFVTGFGSMLVQHAITWHITLSARSGGVMALFTCAALLPMVFISPFAGVWADRYNKKHLVNLSDSVIAAVTLTVAILFMSGVTSYWLLFVASIFRSFGQGVQHPAATALVPEIVPKRELTRFNAILASSQSVTMLASPMLGGALLLYLPIEYIFFIDVITAIIGISIVFFCVKINPLPRKEKTEKSHFLSEMKEGLNYVFSTPWLRTLMVCFAIFSILASPAAMLTPLQVTRSFGADVWRLTAIEITFSVGMMAGGILIAAWGGFKNKAHSMIFAIFVFGATTVLFGVVASFFVYLGIMLLCGLTIPLFNTPSMALMQEKVPTEILGRVFSVITVLSGVAMPIGMALFGPLADVMKIEILLIVTGALLICGGFIMCGQKELISISASESAIEHDKPENGQE